MKFSLKFLFIIIFIVSILCYTYTEFKKIHYIDVKYSEWYGYEIFIGWKAGINRKDLRIIKKYK